MLAAECNDPALVKALLAAGVKMNVKNKVGANALHAAARKEIWRRSKPLRMPAKPLMNRGAAEQRSPSPPSGR
jgi:hypothetical protein